MPNAFDSLRRNVILLDEVLSQATRITKLKLEETLHSCGVSLKEYAIAYTLTFKQVTTMLKADRSRKITRTYRVSIEKLDEITKLRDYLREIVNSVFRRTFLNILSAVRIVDVHPGPKTSVEVYVRDLSNNRPVELGWYLRGFILTDVGTHSPRCSILRFESTLTTNIAIGIVTMGRGRLYVDTLKYALLDQENVRLKLVFYSHCQDLVRWKYEILFDDKRLQEFLDELNERVEARPEDVAAFIAGLLDGDGYIDPVNRKLAICISLTAKRDMAKLKAKVVLRALATIGVLTDNACSISNIINCKIPLSIRRLRSKNLLDLIPNYMLNIERRNKLLHIV